MASTDTTKPEGARPARRTIVKGAAWAVPVVTVASATPAFAASPCLEFVFAGDSCKNPGPTCTYELELQVTNTCNTTVELTITSLLSNSGAEILANEVSFTITPGSNGPFPIPSVPSPNCANFIDIYYTIDDGPVQNTPGQGIPSPPDCEAEEPAAKTESTEPAPSADTEESTATNG